MDHKNHKAMHDHRSVQTTTVGDKGTRWDNSRAILDISLQSVDEYVSCSFFHFVVETERSGWSHT